MNYGEFSVKIDPFEKHPETPSTKSRGKGSITINQLSGISDDLELQVDDSRPGIWGYRRDDIKLWLRDVVNEAKKKISS